MIQVSETEIIGCLELTSDVIGDARGSFCKTFHEDWFAEYGMRTDFKEDYYTWSVHNVLRGLHFQIPPHDHAKLVYCAKGSIFDVAVDLRKNSRTFGRHVTRELSAASGNMMYLSSGLAHGFCVPDDDAIVIYKVTSVYAPEHDRGIRWDSLDIPWPVTAPDISERDSGFPGFDEFDSPFV